MSIETSYSTLCYQLPWSPKSVWCNSCWRAWVPGYALFLRVQVARWIEIHPTLSWDFCPETSLTSSFTYSGKGTPRRKVKKVHKSSGTDDKKLQTSLKKLNVQPIQAIEEVNMFKEDGNVIHFAAPKGKIHTLESYLPFPSSLAPIPHPRYSAMTHLG